MIAAALAIAGSVYASPGMTYSQAAAETGASVAAVEVANPWPATGIPVGVSIRVPGGSGGHVSHRASASGRTWGVSFGYPNRCGDGDGDGWDVNCATRTAYAPRHSSGSSSASAPSYAPRHAAAVTVQAPVSGGSTAVPAWASCIVFRESGGNPRAVNSIPGYIGNGGGLFGDLTSTWGNYGGYHQPFQAPVSVQIAFNQHLKDTMGLSPWAADGCPGT